MRISASALLVLLAFTAGTAQAQDTPKPEADTKAEADICARFDWPLAREQAWFSAADLPALASGSNLPAERPAALLTLRPSADAGLPQAPSRAPKPGSFPAMCASPPRRRPVRSRSRSRASWIDVAEEGGALLKPGAHSGRKGCATLRKSVRFPVGAKPLVVTVSNATAETIRIAVTPVD